MRITQDNVSGSSQDLCAYSRSAISTPRIQMSEEDGLVTCASLQTRASCLLSLSFPASLQPGPLARADLECLPSLGLAPGSGCQPHLPVSTAPGQHGARPSLGSMPPSGCTVLLGPKVKDGAGARLGPRREGAIHLQGPQDPGPAAEQGRGEGPSRPGRSQQLPVYL